MSARGQRISRSARLRALAVSAVIVLVGTSCTTEAEPTVDPTPDPTQDGATAQPSETQADGSPSVSQFDELRVALSSMGNEAVDPTLGPPNNDVFRAFIFDPLVGTDYTTDNLSKDTGIATDWTVSDDGLTYTFQLRPWQFHNGDELTAEDVKFSLDRLRDSPQINQALRDNLDVITVLGPHEVEVRLHQLSLPFLRLMQDHAGFILPKDYFESVGSDGFEAEPIGSGPYRVVERQVGSHISLEQAYPEHFAIGVPRFERVTIRLVTEGSTRLAMLRSGDADLIDVGIRDVTALQEDGYQAIPRKGVETLNVLFQWFRPGEATADINVRKALSYAINREEINEAFLGGLGTVTGTMIHNFGLEPLPAQEYDVEQAQEFLNETPYGEGGDEILNITLQVPIRVGWPDQLAIAQVIQNAWKEIGVQSEILYREYGSFRPEWAEHTLKAPAATLFTQTGPTYTWVAMGRNQFSCAGTLTNHCDERIDILIDEWAAASDEETARTKAAEISQIVDEEFYQLQILEAPQYFAGNERIRSDWTPGWIIGGMNARALAWNVDD